MSDKNLTKSKICPTELDVSDKNDKKNAICPAKQDVLRMTTCINIRFLSVVLFLSLLDVAVNS